MSDDIRVRVLGPVEIAGPHGPVVLRGRGHRTLLARLALCPGQPVASSALIDALWDQAPPTAPKTLRSHVAHMRRDLRAADVLNMIVTRDPGLDACADFVSALLRGCPRLLMLVTSRQPLGVEGEQVLIVPPMPVEHAARPHSGIRCAARSSSSEVDRPPRLQEGPFGVVGGRGDRLVVGADGREPCGPARGRAPGPPRSRWR